MFSSLVSQPIISKFLKEGEGGGRLGGEEGGGWGAVPRSSEGNMEILQNSLSSKALQACLQIDFMFNNSMVCNRKTICKHGKALEEREFCKISVSLEKGGTAPENLDIKSWLMSV